MALAASTGRGASRSSLSTAPYLTAVGRIGGGVGKGVVTRTNSGDAGRVIAATAEQDRCAWALAYYAGLRLGELRALRWGDVDEKAGVIHVQLSWDVVEGEIKPKSTAGVRDVPILAPLLPHLAAQRSSCAWSSDPEGLVLGASRRSPLGYNGLRGRSAAGFNAAGLKRVTLHEARHSFASYLAASGIGIKDLTVILGHSSVTVSLDRYGHLFEAGKAQTAAQINAWFDSADTQARLAQLGAAEGDS